MSSRELKKTTACINPGMKRCKGGGVHTGEEVVRSEPQTLFCPRVPGYAAPSACSQNPHMSELRSRPPHHGSGSRSSARYFLPTRFKTPSPCSSPPLLCFYFLQPLRPSDFLVFITVFVYWELKRCLGDSRHSTALQ